MEKAMRNLVAWATACVLASCQTTTPPTLSALFTDVQTPESFRLPIQSDDILEPIQLVSWDSLLVCTNYFTSKAIRAYNLNDGSCQDLIHIGRAENELLNTSAIWVSADTLNVYGTNTAKILQIPAGELLDPQAAIISRPFPNGYFNLCASASDNRYAAQNSTTQQVGTEPFILLGRQGEAISCFGKYAPADSQTDPRELALIYQGRLAMNASASKVAYASGHGSIFQFFDLSRPDAVRLTREYRFSEPVYISESDPSKALFSVRWTADCRAGALAITPTDDGCIILCDEQKRVSDKNWRISTAYEFDWDGRPRRKLCLGCDVQAITYNPQRRLLIALTTNEQNEYMFIAYRL